MNEVRLEKPNTHLGLSRASLRLLEAAFGSLLLLVLIGIFLFSDDTPGRWKAPILPFLAALLATFVMTPGPSATAAPDGDTVIVELEDGTAFEGKRKKTGRTAVIFNTALGRRTRTDNRGRFSFTNVPQPLEDDRIEVRAKGFEAVAHAGPDPIEVRLGPKE